VVDDAVSEAKAARPARPRISLPLALALGIGVVGLLVHPGAPASAPKVRSGGVVRVALRSADLDSLDPALSYSVASYVLLDTTCAVLLRGSPLTPEVAAGFPRVSRDGKTYTFTLRTGFRFSDGTPVRASAFARAINRTLAPGVESPWAAYTRNIVGAEDVLAGRTRGAAGVAARGNTLVVRLKRPAPDFPAQTTFMCAVPPALPADPEGVAAFPAAGPYYVAEYRPAERVVIRRNRFYGGKRPHHVDGFTVDLRVSSHEEVLDRIERGTADWGWALAPAYFDPARRLAAKYGVNESQFFLQPGFTFRGYAFNVSRPLFRNNPKLRRAVNFAIDRTAFRRAAGGPLSSRLTDQYLPPGIAGFKDARIYPLSGPDLRRARALARGNTRSGKVVLYTIDLPFHLSFAQSIRQNLAQIGLDVQIKGIPLPAYFGRLMARGPYDLGFATWTPDYADPYAVLNLQLDGRFIGATNWARFDSAQYNSLLRRAALLQGAPRYRTYGELDVQLARDAAPMVAVDFLNDATLVSKRIGCVKLKPTFQLTTVCLK
jgi:peptide/nickel transport system substrate-binding protein